MTASRHPEAKASGEATLESYGKDMRITTMILCAACIAIAIPTEGTQRVLFLVAAALFGANAAYLSWRERRRGHE